jgi:hypothetical protein
MRYLTIQIYAGVGAPVGTPSTHPYFPPKNEHCMLSYEISIQYTQLLYRLDTNSISYTAPLYSVILKGAQARDFLFQVSYTIKAWECNQRTGETIHFVTFDARFDVRK